MLLDRAVRCLHEERERGGRGGGEEVTRGARGRRGGGRGGGILDGGHIHVGQRHGAYEGSYTGCLFRFRGAARAKA